jgi:hypothetical protein
MRCPTWPSTRLFACRDYPKLTRGRRRYVPPVCPATTARASVHQGRRPHRQRPGRDRRHAASDRPSVAGDYYPALDARPAIVLFQPENLSGPRPGAMRGGLRSFCPPLTAVDRSTPGIRGPMESRQPLGCCCTPASAEPWTVTTSISMPTSGRPRWQPGSNRPEPMACMPCGTSTHRCCWMPARASSRASPCGPTPTCCQPANSEQGRPSTAPSREVQQRPTACPRTPRCRSRGGTPRGGGGGGRRRPRARACRRARSRSRRR